MLFYHNIHQPFQSSLASCALAFSSPFFMKLNKFGDVVIGNDFFDDAVLTIFLVSRFVSYYFYLVYNNANVILLFIVC